MSSLWRQTAPIAPRPPLQGDLETEAAVIGGGLAGILTAALLRESGVDVVVLEADRIGSGQTENTTAKVTGQHGMLYHRLERSWNGLLGVQQYLSGGGPVRDAGAAGSLLEDARRSIPLPSSQAMALRCY